MKTVKRSLLVIAFFFFHFSIHVYRTIGKLSATEKQIIGTIRMMGAAISRKWKMVLGKIIDEYTLPIIRTNNDATNGIDDMDSRCCTYFSSSSLFLKRNDQVVSFEISLRDRIPHIHNIYIHTMIVILSRKLN